jgi:hypothetical protein
MDLYGLTGGCGAQRKGASIYTWNPEALLGITLIKGFEGLKINIDQGNYLSMPSLTFFATDPYPPHILLRHCVLGRSSKCS